jgi:hypothetical protein
MNKELLELVRKNGVDPVYVMCINNRNTHTPLTIGKKYEVVGEGKGHYTIQDDIGTLCCMQKDRFAKASDPARNTGNPEPVIEPIAGSVRDKDGKIYPVMKWVKCINTGGYEHHREGCYYPVVKMTAILTYILNDNKEIAGMIHDYYLEKQPEPIKFEDEVPECVYMITDKAIKREKVVAFIQTKKLTSLEKTEEIEFDYGGKHSFTNCYKTLDEAIIVAKKNWGIK